MNEFTPRDHNKNSTNEHPSRGALIAAGSILALTTVVGCSPAEKVDETPSHETITDQNVIDAIQRGPDGSPFIEKGTVGQDEATGIVVQDLIQGVQEAVTGEYEITATDGQTIRVSAELINKKQHGNVLPETDLTAWFDTETGLIVADSIDNED